MTSSNLRKLVASTLARRAYDRVSAELRDIVPYLRTLDCYQRPNYSMFYDGLLALIKRIGTKPSDPYDWETREQVERVLKNTKPAAWEDAADFFKSDPINIHAPPLPNVPLEDSAAASGGSSNRSEMSRGTVAE
ncbi:unnamed protein product [Heligmosomoides polygyrus]|uniref:NADH dehydrogenase [ubiquinone] 1 alpha subcomplex subunit 6 n=1 Tax=Heligmosomoides polygyrus TaxID=6339 RepID=A0A183G5Z7_HELPZ|nr:unnamed protein product [Heligmosomoides polygyrus]